MSFLHSTGTPAAGANQGTMPSNTPSTAPPQTMRVRHLHELAVADDYLAPSFDFSRLHPFIVKMIVDYVFMTKPTWRTLRPLRTTCRFFEEIIADEPRFWARLDVKDGPNMTLHSIERSKDVLLTIDYSESIPEVAAVVEQWRLQGAIQTGEGIVAVGMAFWQRLRHYSFRWGSILLETRSSDILQMVLPLQAPKLYQVAILHPTAFDELDEDENTEFEAHIQGPAFGNSLVNLTYVRLWHWSFPWGGPMPCLKKIFLNGQQRLSVHQIVAILATCPDLEELAMFDCFREAPDPEQLDDAEDEANDEEASSDDNPPNEVGEDSDTSNDGGDDDDEAQLLPNPTNSSVNHLHLRNCSIRLLKPDQDAQAFFEVLLPSVTMPATMLLDIEVHINYLPLLVAWIEDASSKWTPSDTINVWLDPTGISVELSKELPIGSPQRRFSWFEDEDDGAHSTLLWSLLEALPSDICRAIHNIQIIQDDAADVHEILETLVTTFTSADCLSLREFSMERTVELLAKPKQGAWIFERMATLYLWTSPHLTQEEFENASREIRRGRRSDASLHDVQVFQGN